MNRPLLRIAALFGLGLASLAGCRPCRNPASETSKTPTPTPRPTPPQPIYVPAKRMETSKLFNGIQIHATVETENGVTAQEERGTPSSYMLELQLKVKVPKPHSSLRELSRLNDQLPRLLPWLDGALRRAKISRFYDDLYRIKVVSLNRDLVRLDQLISRQHFFDCETVLELQDARSKRRALLIQAAMEVDTDGSDSDRVPAVDASSSTYQPMTSYKWSKKTERQNPFLAVAEERLGKYEQELAGRNAKPERSRELRDSLIPAARYEANQLKKSSFLVAAADPYVVLPGSLVSQNYEPYAPKLGDYCVVIYKNVLYPAIVGDVGPGYKIGEASLRICKEINALSNANNRPVSELKVTYLVFPNSADKPFTPPDLDKWRTRCDQLLTELGGYKGELFAWEDLTKPKPTPTPTPAPSPAPSPGASPAASPAGSPSASAAPGALKQPSPAPGIPSSPSALPSPSPAGTP